MLLVDYVLQSQQPQKQLQHQKRQRQQKVVRLPRTAILLLVLQCSFSIHV